MNRHYRLALYLSASITVAELLLFFYVFTFGGYEAASRAVVRVAVPLVILFGLWVTSGAARYIGAVWFLIVAASTIWPLFMGGPIVLWYPVAWGVIVGALSLVAVWLLALSKQFSTEFARQREVEPAYKKTLRRLAIVAIVLAALIATANDIYHLLSA